MSCFNAYLGDEQSKTVSSGRLDGAMGSGGSEWVGSMLTHRAYAALFVEAVGLVGTRSMQPKAAYRAVTDMPECAGERARRTKHGLCTNIDWTTALKANSEFPCETGSDIT